MINLRSIEPLLLKKMDLEERNLQLSVDNRKLDENSIFLAIMGERYNPLNHLELIKNSGCTFVLYQKNSQNDQSIQEFKDEIVFLPVENMIDSIAKIGAIVANEFKQRSGKIIAISGSNGKTTTKEMLNHILSKTYGEEKVICTQKNNNNHLGVPFTLFQINEETKFAIVELGSNAPGEIEFLCKMIVANIGVTTNIGDTHLEFFGTRDAVFKEEGILANYCDEMFFVNADDELLKKIENDAKKLSFGKNGVNYRFRFLEDSVAVNDYVLVNSLITGEHNFQNLAVAFSLAHYLNPDNSKNYINAAQSFEPTANRSQWIKIGEIPTFLDAYNANPSSMKVAIDGFCQYLEKHGSTNSEACVILGDMNELGDNSDSLHAQVGEFALSKGFAAVVFVGRFRDDYTQESSENIFKFASTDEASQFVKDRLGAYKYLFIKGSRSLQLERIADIK